MTESVRIVISGDVKGKLGLLYKRIATIEKKAGKFDMLFCVGDFFGEKCDFDNYSDGSQKAPLDTYVVGPVTAAGKKFVTNPDGCALTANITYLGRRGLFSGSTGIRVVYVSGLGATRVQWPGKSGANADPVIASKRLVESDLDAVTNQLRGDPGGGVDILLTAQWPGGVERWTRPIIATSQNDKGEKEEKKLNSLEFGSALISRLAKELEPRYHISATHGIHYERPPYRNHAVLQQKYKHVTRFVGLAEVKNPLNRQYLYALKLVPMKKMSKEELVAQPSDVTANPYREGQQVRVLEEPKDEPEESQTAEVVEGREMEVQTEQYFFDLPKSMMNRRAGKRKYLESKNTKIEKKPRQSAPCWFCLGNPQVERHLVVSIGVQVYLAAPRGPLVPEHMLIIPIGHHQSWVMCPDGVRDEMGEYKRSIQKFYKSMGRVMVVFERNFKSHHLQIQTVPVPIATAAECKKSFLQFASMQKPPLEFQELPKRSELSEICPENRPYFYVELPAGERLLAMIEKQHFEKIDLQLARAALSSGSVLGCPHRVDWKDCAVSKDEETAEVIELRKAFSPFDFN